jgi:hypothetical protein
MIPRDLHQNESPLSSDQRVAVFAGDGALLAQLKDA